MRRSEAERAGRLAGPLPPRTTMAAGRARMRSCAWSPEVGEDPCPEESAAKTGECRTGRGPEAGCAGWNGRLDCGSVSRAREGSLCLGEGPHLALYLRPARPASAPSRAPLLWSVAGGALPVWLSASVPPAPRAPSSSLCTLRAPPCGPPHRACAPPPARSPRRAFRAPGKCFRTPAEAR